MNKEKALKNQGLEFREDIIMLGGLLKKHLYTSEICDIQSSMLIDYSHSSHASAWLCCSSMLPFRGE